MANKKRLIDANALFDELLDRQYREQSMGIAYSWYPHFRAILTAQPTVDAVEVVHGYDTCRCRIFHCSECGYGVNDIFQEDERNYPVGEFNYCPNCGAKMDGDDDT